MKVVNDQFCETSHQKALTMKTEYTIDQIVTEDETDINNIISINSAEDIEDMLDFDLDYDVNEMYFALNGSK